MKCRATDATGVTRVATDPYRYFGVSFLCWAGTGDFVARADFIAGQTDASPHLHRSHVVNSAPSNATATGDDRYGPQPYRWHVFGMGKPSGAKP